MKPPDIRRRRQSIGLSTQIPEWLRLLLPSIGALIVLAFTLWAGYRLARLPYDGLDWNGDYRIRRVDTGSPAATAGLQVGDVILAVDGVPAPLAYPWYGDQKPGEAIAYAVGRGDRRWSVSLPLGPTPWGERARRLEPVLIALSFWLIGLVVWARKPRDGTTRLFFALTQMGALALAAGNLSAFHLVVGRRLLFVVFGLLAPTLIHFHARFPAARALPRRRLLLGLLYGLGLLLATPHLLLDLPAPLTPQRWGERGAGWPSLLVLGYLSTAMLVALAFLFRTYRTASAPAQRQVRLVTLGTAGAWLPLLAGAMVPTVLWDRPVLPYELAYPCLLLIPLAYAYAIRRYRLMALDRFLNRSLVYLMLTLWLAGFYLLLSAVLSRVGLARFLREPLAVTLVALAVAVTFHSLRDRLQRWADRLFYGGWYDYQTVVHGTGQSLVAASEPAALARALLDGLTVAMRLRCACLLLAEGSGSRVSACVPAGEGCPLLTGQTLTLPRRGALARRLAEEVGLVYGIQLRRALSGEPLSRVEEALLACPHGRLWVPLRREGRLLAALVLGPKPGEEPFGAEDRAILESVARETAVVMENLALVGEVEQRAMEVERLHGELLAAREAERKRVARELHDGVLQELIAAYRGLRTRPHLDPEAAEARVAETEAKLRELMDEARRICADLRPAVLDVLGLAEAVHSQAEVFGLHSGIAVRVTVAGDAEVRLPEAVEVCLFRVLQEALRNVEQHARASEVEVVLEMPVDLEGGSGRAWGGKKEKREKVEKGNVVLVVRDDGRGFVVPRRLGLLLDQSHFGLVGLRERLALVGGTLGVSSGPGRGTELVAQVPLEARGGGDGVNRNEILTALGPDLDRRHLK